MQCDQAPPTKGSRGPVGAPIDGQSGARGRETGGLANLSGHSFPI